MNNLVPKLNIRKIKGITSLLTQEQLGLAKKLAAIALDQRDIKNITTPQALVIKDFFLNSSFRLASLARKLIVLNLVKKDDSDLIITYDLLQLAGYNGIDSDDLKKEENRHMLENDDLIAWAKFLEI